MFIALSKVRLITDLGSGGTTPIIIKGPWNADTNVPFLQSGVGTPGDAYIVSVAGTTNLDGVTDWQVLDIAIFGVGVWSKIDRTPLFPLIPSRVLITDATGNPATSDFLKFNSVSGLLESYTIETASITSTGSSKIFAAQNTVNANRDLTAADLGVTLSAGSPGHTVSLPASGILNGDSSFQVAQFTADTLTVSAIAPTTLNGVVGGTFVTPGINTLTTFMRNGDGGGTDDWYYYIVSEEGSVPSYNEIYSNDPTASTTIVAGKPLKLESTTEGSRLTSMTEAQFGAIPAPLDGLKSWTTDNSRELHRRNGGSSKVAYLEDIVAIEEDVAYGSAGFKGNSTETIISTSGVAVKVVGTYVAGKEFGMTHAAGALTYNELPPRTLRADAVITGTYNGATGNISVLIAKDGAVIEESETAIDLKGASPSFNLLVSAELIDVVQGNYIEVFVRNNSDSGSGIENITIEKLKLIVHSMGGASTGQNVDEQQAYDNGDGIVTMTANKPRHTLAATSGQKRGEVIVKMSSAEFASIPGPILSEAAVTTDEVAGATRLQMKTKVGGIPTTSSFAFLTDLTSGDNVVTSWDGSTTPVAVTAGINIDITGGVISAPGYGADTSQVIISNSSQLSNTVITRSFTTKKGLLTNVQMEITTQFDGFSPTIEFALPFITAFSPVLNPKEVFAMGEVIDWLGQGSNATPGGMIGQVEPVPGTNRVLFTINVGGTITATPNPGKIRFDFTYRNFPIS